MEKPHNYAFFSNNPDKIYIFRGVEVRAKNWEEAKTKFVQMINSEMKEKDYPKYERDPEKRAPWNR